MNPAIGRRATYGLAFGLVLSGAACAASSNPSGGGVVGSGGNTSSGTGGSAAGSGGSTGVDGGFGDAVSGTGGSGTGGASSGSGGATGSGGFIGGGGAGGASANCLVSIVPVSPSSFLGLESGPNVKLRVMATIRNPGPRAVPVWTWNVMFGGDGSVVPYNMVGNDPKLIEFPIANPGNYDITVRVDTGVACLMGEQIPVVNLPSPSLLFRVTPPSNAGLPIPPQDIKVGFNGPVPSTTVLRLVGGTAYSVSPQEDQLLTFIPSYVRISDLSSGVVAEGYTASGPVNTFLLPSAHYDVLVIPDGLIAPVLLPATLPVVGGAFVLDAGILVTGTTLDGNGAPLPGVRIVLRDGPRPSTVGVSGSGGQFSLLSGGGQNLSAVLVPPSNSGLPEVHVSADPGIALDSNSNLNLQMRWAPVAQAAMSVSIQTSDGSAPVAGATVRVESVAELPSTSVGTLDTQSTSLQVTGSVIANVIADDAGVARIPNLPVGSYVVTAVPPMSATASSGGLTMTVINLAPTGYTGTLPLALPVRISGTLLPANVAQGARVTAYDTSPGITTTAVSTIAGAGGTYTLLVAPGLSGNARQYQLVADPTASSHLARTVLGKVAVNASDAYPGNLKMTPGIPFAGTVQSGAGTLEGAFVQVFCSGSACLDPKTAVAEAVTQQDGSFTVVVPIPATGP